MHILPAKQNLFSFINTNRTSLSHTNIVFVLNISATLP